MFWKKKKVDEVPPRKVGDFFIVELNYYMAPQGRGMVEFKNFQQFIDRLDPNAILYLHDGFYIQEFDEVVVSCRKQ